MAEISCDFSLHGEWGDASSVEPDPGGCGSAGADGTCPRTAEQINARRTALGRHPAAPLQGMGTRHRWADRGGRARDHVGASDHSARTPRNRTSYPCRSPRLLWHDRHFLRVQQPGQFGREYLDPRKLSVRLAVLQGAMGNGPRLAALLSLFAL